MSDVHESAAALARDQADFESGMRRRGAQPEYAEEYAYILRALNAIGPVREALERAQAVLRMAERAMVHTVITPDTGEATLHCGDARDKIRAALTLLDNLEVGRGE